MASDFASTYFPWCSFAVGSSFVVVAVVWHCPRFGSSCCRSMEVVAMNHLVEYVFHYFIARGVYELVRSVGGPPLVVFAALLVTITFVFIRRHRRG